MNDVSKTIKWATTTWNPITGCSHAGTPGCDHCYAKRMATRLAGRCGYDQESPFKVTFHEDRLYEPLKWKKPRMIFVCSMGDIAHPDVTTDMFDAIMSVISVLQDKGHIFMMLTKRPERLYELLMKKGDNQNDGWLRHMRNGKPLPNLWIGVTVETWRSADKRVESLYKIPAVKRFLSVEPMLDSINLHCVSWAESNRGYADITTGRTEFEEVAKRPHAAPPVQPIDWVICGGETGRGARPMNPEWVRSLRDECNVAGIPFFFKSWGWASLETGRLLDGRGWNEMPCTR